MLAYHGNKLQGAVENDLFLISYANVVAVFFEIRFDFRYRVIGWRIIFQLKSNQAFSLEDDESKWFKVAAWMTAVGLGSLTREVPDLLGP